jgi:DNA polymerase I-like protein with 3'-5' exonuclease and polymerase domains
VRPNLQQLSRQGGVRACITADPGMMIISADFNAVELRVAAALSQDAALIEMIIEGDRCRAQQQLAKIAGDAQAAEYWKQQAALYDLHWRIARQVWGPDATKEDRYNAKRGVFGHLYGAGTPNVAGTLGISMAEAQAVKDTLAAQVPGVESWSGQIRQYVRGGGTSIQAYSGRTIWLDKRQPHKGPNYLIQGSGKELLTDALLKWRQTRWGDSVILPVHDEVLAVVPEDDAAAATEALVEAMSSELHGVPIVAEASEPSYAWADAS